MLSHDTPREASVMAHVRNRHIKDIFDTLLKFSPIVGVFGHRQVGKTTFLAASVNDYRTLDDVDTLAEAHSAPKAFIHPKGKGAVAIDECQQVPLLFPTLKERVRLHKQPGQYVPLVATTTYSSRWIRISSTRSAMKSREKFGLNWR